MKIVFSKIFQKTYQKANKKIKNQFADRLGLFMADEQHPLLRNHSLKGSYAGTRSISITGDFRAHYEVLADGTRYFTVLGTHSELYEKH